MDPWPGLLSPGQGVASALGGQCPESMPRVTSQTQESSVERSGVTRNFEHRIPPWREAGVVGSVLTCCWSLATPAEPTLAPCSRAPMKDMISYTFEVLI